MTEDNTTSVRWSGLIAIISVHAMALGLLFLLVVFVGRSFVDHYAVIGVASTPEFDTVKSASDFLTKYSITVVAAIIADALVIRRLAAKSARWLSAYSHTYLAGIVLAMFIAIAYMINPMVWNSPNPAVAPLQQVVASLP